MLQNPAREHVMAKKAVEMTVLALRGAGPSILKSQFGGLPRLQAAPDDKHVGAKDPHVGGRALDIILLADRDYERLFADMIVEVFLEMRDDMRWGAVIYNKVEWTSAGQELPRIWNPKMKEKDPVRFEHTTHIHIEWSTANAERGDFWIGLVEALRERF
jgi:hypothetical protein